jgi:hypothetical protein
VTTSILAQFPSDTLIRSPSLSEDTTSIVTRFPGDTIILPTSLRAEEKKLDERERSSDTFDPLHLALRGEEKKLDVRQTPDGGSGVPGLASLAAPDMATVSRLLRAGQVRCKAGVKA